MLIDLIDDARAHGARIIEVGHRPGDATRRPHTHAPTVVLGVTDEMKIAHEEIFGPILPIFRYGPPHAQPCQGIFEQGRWNLIELLRAPFGSRANALLKFLLR